MSSLFYGVHYSILIGLIIMTVLVCQLVSGFCAYHSCWNLPYWVIVKWCHLTQSKWYKLVTFQCHHGDGPNFDLCLQQVCVARSAQGQSSNVATWLPLVCNHGTGITLGTQKGSLYYWGLDNRDDCFSKSTVNFHERSHIPAYPQVPIPPIQMRPTTNSDQ